MDKSMKKAIVTLAVGKRHGTMFEKHCRLLWSQYAEKYGFDLIVYADSLDDSALAKSRSPAWQKCLVLSNPTVQKYEQVVWIDSDILINPTSPDVTAGVPADKVGVVDQYSSPTSEDYQIHLKRLYEYWKWKNVEGFECLTPTEFHRLYGFEGEFNSVVNTGVMVLSPEHHKCLLEHVYYNYEDKGNKMLYEMRPLSFEILTQRLEHWISPKFNMIWPDMKTYTYPFFPNRKGIFEKGLKKLNVEVRASLLKKCVTTAFLNNYFLHFAGGSTPDMRFVDTKISSQYKFLT